MLRNNMNAISIDIVTFNVSSTSLSRSNKKKLMLKTSSTPAIKGLERIRFRFSLLFFIRFLFLSIFASFIYFVCRKRLNSFEYFTNVCFVLLRLVHLVFISFNLRMLRVKMGQMVNFMQPPLRNNVLHIAGVFLFVLLNIFFFFLIWFCVCIFYLMKGWLCCGCKGSYTRLHIFPNGIWQSVFKRMVLKIFYQFQWNV